MDTDIRALYEILKEMNEEIDKRASQLDFERINRILCERMDRLEKDRGVIRKEVNEQIERRYADFQTKLEANKQEIISRPSEIPDLRRLIDQKIELIELNGQNAVLRSANNEKQIMLVERKIENIYQLIKRIDINKQEAAL